MFCEKCGAQVADDQRFCPKCSVKKNAFVYFTDALKKYVVFKGRARRAEYWWFSLFVFVISLILGLINEWLQSIVSLAFFLPGLSVGWRRMHDVGKPGGFAFIPIYSLILACTAGVEGPNEYGPDPKVEA